MADTIVRVADTIVVLQGAELLFELADRAANSASNAEAAVATAAPLIADLALGSASKIAIVAANVASVNSVAENIDEIIAAPDAATLARLYAISDTDAPIAGAVSTADRGARYEAGRARAWAESTTPPVTGSKSSKTWAGESAAYAATAGNALGSVNTARDNALATISTAQAAILALANLYQTVSSGLAATAPDGFFAVAGGGDVAATLYQKVNGAAVLYAALASQAALDHFGRFIPNMMSVDNAIAINAAFGVAAVSGVILPAGDIRIDRQISLSSGKFIRGAGRGVTRLIRPDRLSTADYAMIKATNATGVQISDLDCICPTNNHSFNGIHMFNTKYFSVERTDVYNAAYSYWPQEYSRFGYLNLCGSHNANVHYETTQAYDVLFENGNATDGVGDNPAGTEAVWHCLLASRDITFRNMRHEGKGHPFLLVANDINGDPLGGLIDNIRFEKCRSVMTEGRFAFMASVYNGQIGRLYFDDCVVSAPDLLGLFTKGTIRMKNCEITCGGVEGFEVVPGAATLESIDTDVTINYNSDSLSKDGGVYGPYDNARMKGGSITVTPANATPFIPVRGDAYATKDAKFVGVRAFTVLGIRRPAEYVFPEYTSPSTGDWQAFGFGTSQSAEFLAGAGQRYRVRFAGAIRPNTSGYGLFFGESSGVYTDPGTYGGFWLEQPDGSMAFDKFGAFNSDELADPTIPRRFEVDVTFLGQGSVVTIVSRFNGKTLMAGAEMTVERIA